MDLLSRCRRAFRTQRKDRHATRKQGQLLVQAETPGQPYRKIREGPGAFHQDCRADRVGDSQQAGRRGAWVAQAQVVKGLNGVTRSRESKTDRVTPFSPWTTCACAT